MKRIIKDHYPSFSRPPVNASIVFLALPHSWVSGALVQLRLCNLTYNFSLKSCHGFPFFLSLVSILSRVINCLLLSCYYYRCHSQFLTQSEDYHLSKHIPLDLWWREWFLSKLLQDHASMSPYPSLIPISSVRSRVRPCSLSSASLSKSTAVEQRYVGNFIYFQLEDTKVPPTHLHSASHCFLKAKLKWREEKESFGYSSQRPYNCCPFQCHRRHGFKVGYYSFL